MHYCTYILRTRKYLLYFVKEMLHLLQQPPRGRQDEDASQGRITPSRILVYQETRPDKPVSVPTPNGRSVRIPELIFNEISGVRWQPRNVGFSADRRSPAVLLSTINFS